MCNCMFLCGVTIYQEAGRAEEEEDSGGAAAWLWSGETERDTHAHADFCQ